MNAVFVGGSLIGIVIVFFLTEILSYFFDSESDKAKREPTLAMRTVKMFAAMGIGLIVVAAFAAGIYLCLYGWIGLIKLINWLCIMS